MKKILLLFLFFVLCFSVSASAKTYLSSSEEVQTLLYLSTYCGTPLPLITYPATSDFLLKMLDRIDVSKLHGSLLLKYEKLKKALTDTPVLFKTGDVTVEGDASLLIFDFIKGDEIIRYNRMLPMIDLDAEIGISKYFYGVFDISFYPKQFSGFVPFLGGRINSVYNVADAQLSYPTRSYGSISAGPFSFTVGRDRLSAGAGITGNLSFSENFLYEDFLKLSVFSYPFSYDFTAVSFNYWDFDESGTPFIHITDLSSHSKTLLNHRFSAVIADKVSVSINEGCTVFTSGLLSDLKALNPFMMIHNTLSFFTGNSNNYFGVEVSYPIIPNLKVNLSTFFDQIKMSDEESGSGENAFGVLLNLNGTFDLNEYCIIEPYFEFVYGSPQLYLKEDENYYRNLIENKDFYPYVNNMNVDLIGDNYMRYENESAYIGYPYGGDIVVVALGTVFRNLRDSAGEHSLFDVSSYRADLMFRSKGSYGIGVNEDRTVSESHVNKVAEKSLKLSVGAEGTVFRCVDFLSELAGIYKWNYQHTDENRFDLQFRIALNFRLKGVLK